MTNEETEQVAVYPFREGEMSRSMSIRHASTVTGPIIPALIAAAGDHAARRFLEFFAANIRNPNTRAAYATAVRQFLGTGKRGRR